MRHILQNGPWRSQGLPGCERLATALKTVKKTQNIPPSLRQKCLRMNSEHET